MCQQVIFAADIWTWDTQTVSEAAIKVTCSICDFPAMTSQNICCKVCNNSLSVFNVRLTTQLITSSTIMAFNSITFINKADLHCKQVV